MYMNMNNNVYSFKKKFKLVLQKELTKTYSGWRELRLSNLRTILLIHLIITSWKEDGESAIYFLIPSDINNHEPFN